MECVFCAGRIFGSPSLRGDAIGFSVEDSVVFLWDQGLSRIPVGNSGRILTIYMMNYMILVPLKLIYKVVITKLE